MIQWSKLLDELASVKRSRLLAFGQLLLGIGLLLSLLLWQDNASKLVDVLLRMQWQYIIPLLLLSLLLLGVSSLKWQLFLQDRNPSVPLHRLVRLYAIGHFFNNFFPSQIGGDVARAMVLGRNIKSQSRSMASVFLERLTGLVALLTLGCFSALVRPSLLSEPYVAAALVAMASACAAIILTVLLPISIIRGVLRPFAQGPLRKVFHSLIEFRSDIRYFKGRPYLLVQAMVYSYVFHFLAIANVYLAALSIQFTPNFLDLMVLVPIILLITSVPLTPNSIGVWEWAFSLLLLTAGAQAEQGIAVSMILRAKTLLVSLFGGLFFLQERNIRENLPANSGTPGASSSSQAKAN